jgi:hypothetical protein
MTPREPIQNRLRFNKVTISAIFEAWFAIPAAHCGRKSTVMAVQMEISRLRAELARVSMERDIPGKATAHPLTLS